jgi:hypothetical protein
MCLIANNVHTVEQVALCCGHYILACLLEFSKFIILADTLGY